MSFTRSYEKDKDGQITAIRDTRDDGRVSYVYEYKQPSIAGEITSTILPWVDAERGDLIDKQEHDPDGTTRSVK